MFTQNCRLLEENDRGDFASHDIDIFESVVKT